MVSAALLSSCIGIHKKSPQNSHQLWRTESLWLGTHKLPPESVSLPMFFYSQPDSSGFTQRCSLSYSATLLLHGHHCPVICPVPLQLISVSLASLPSTCGLCLFQKRPPLPKRNTFTKENAQRNSEGRNNDQ